MLNSKILLKEFKEETGITWDYEDSKIERHIKSGVQYLQDKCNNKLDFSDNERHKQLLFNYCIYARSQKLDWFEMNYLSEILDLMIGANLPNE